MNADVTAENKPDYAKPHGKRQTPGTRINTYKDERGIQIFIIPPFKIPAVSFHLSLELVVELRPWVSPRFSATQHGLQGIVEGVFQFPDVR